MEVSGVVLGKIPSVSDCRFSGLRSVSGFSGNRKMVAFPRKFREFADRGHVSYYSDPIRCGGDKEKVKIMEKEKKEMKKKAKVLKSLSKNLNMFSSLGFGLDPEAGLISEVQNKTISEATEILVKQIEQLKAEEKLLKKQRKEEKAKAKAMKMNNDMDSESSSSSSESSDSDCDKSKVVDMSSFRNKANPSLEPFQPKSPVATLPRIQDSLLKDNAHSCKNTGELLQLALLQAAAPSTVSPSMANPGQTLKTGEANLVVGLPLKRKEDSLLQDDAQKNTAEALQLALLQAYPSLANPGQTVKKAETESVVGLPSKRVEVCMGGKCKKSGGALLLNEFQRAMTGLEGTAVACKCMGKCRDGPNVRVTNETNTAMTDSVRTQSKTVCLGVGVQDVEAIVTSFFGEEGRKEEEEGLSYV